jgi:hypothetical protein
MEFRNSNIRVSQRLVLMEEQADRDQRREVKKWQEESVKNAGWLAIGSDLPPSRRSPRRRQRKD